MTKAASLCIPSRALYSPFSAPKITSVTSHWLDENLRPLPDLHPVGKKEQGGTKEGVGKMELTQLKDYSVNHTYIYTHSDTNKAEPEAKSHIYITFTM